MLECSSPTSVSLEGPLCLRHLRGGGISGEISLDCLAGLGRDLDSQGAPQTMQLFFKCKKRPEIPDQLLCTGSPDKGALCLPAWLLLPLSPRKGLGLNFSQPDPPQPSLPRPASQEVTEAGKQTQAWPVTGAGGQDKGSLQAKETRDGEGTLAWVPRVPGPSSVASLTDDPFSGPHLAKTSEPTPRTQHLYPTSWTHLSKPHRMLHGLL